jgi:lipoprotein-anchoring transpeptidase ErfK/SrfK
VVIAAGALLLLAGCNGDAKSGGQATASRTTHAPAPPATVQLSLADGSTDVSPATPLAVTVTGGTLEDVTVVDGDGQPLQGTVAAAHDGSGNQVWTPTEPLAYGTKYTVTAKAENADHEAATATSTFTTVTPRRLSTPDVGPLNGATVGVALPIRVYFDRTVPEANRAEVERHLQVVSSTPTDGTWNWLSGTQLHFRPSQYWPPNTDVTLNENLFGVDLGNGIWGEKNRTVSFHVGAKHVSVADAATHTMQVFDGDQLVQTFPMSAGSDANPTRNGAHVVTELRRKITMDSSTFGLAVDAPGGYRADVEYATRISNNGEFVHAAPWSVGSQGNANVSHGCINLSTDRAAWFFGFSQPGDVVEVKNSVGPQLSRADGDIFDWTISWEDWKAGSALK